MISLLLSTPGFYIYVAFLVIFLLAALWAAHSLHSGTQPGSAAQPGAAPLEEDRLPSLPQPSLRGAQLAPVAFLSSAIRTKAQAFLAPIQPFRVGRNSPATRLRTE